MSAFWLKLPSLVSGLLSVLLAHEFVRRVTSSRWAAPIAAGLVALLPVFVEQSTELRGYGHCLVLVWLSFFAFLKLQQDFECFRRHVVLAAVLFGALMLEYAALFHFLALAALAVAPLVFRREERPGVRRLAWFSAPYITALGLFAVLFAVQFSARVPEYGHTTPFVYGGDLSDVASVLTFFLERAQYFFAGMSPGPGLWLVPLLLLGALVFPSQVGSPWRRQLAVYGVLSISMLFAASLVGAYPFGGVPRHAVAVVPGIFLACYLASVELLSRLRARPAAQVLVAVVVLLAFLPGWVASIRANARALESRMTVDFSERVDEFEASPVNLVTNWRGRNLASWWLLRNRTAHRAAHDPQTQVFDYDGLSLIEVGKRGSITDEARACAAVSGTCWLMLGYLDRDTSGWNEVEKELTGQSPNIAAELLVEGHLGVPVRLVRVVRRPTVSAGPPIER